MHNEAWIVIEGNTNSNGQTRVEIECSINECQPGQTKQGGKCIACNPGQNNCESCLGGYIFVVAACMLNPGYKEIASSTKWRVWLPKFHAPR